MKDNTGTTGPNSDADDKLAYHKPELKVYGALRTITLNPTPGGSTESGLGAGYAETVFIDPNYDDAGWSRRNVEPSGGRGSRGG